RGQVGLNRRILEQKHDIDIPQGRYQLGAQFCAADCVEAETVNAVGFLFVFGDVDPNWLLFRRDVAENVVGHDAPLWEAAARAGLVETGEIEYEVSRSCFTSRLRPRPLPGPWPTFYAAGDS